MRYFLFIFLCIISVQLLGCSGGSSPVSPDYEYAESPELSGENDGTGESRQNWGLFELNFDADSGLFEPVSTISSSTHYRVPVDGTGSLAADNIHLTFAGIDNENNVISFDMTLTNPFDRVKAFDVRAIIVSDDPGYYIVNADGAVKLNQTEFPATFISFATESESRGFGPGESYTERFELHFPDDPKFRKLNLIIDGSYPSNCTEPYGFRSFGFSGKSLSIGVADWQDDVDSVTLMTSYIGEVNDIDLVSGSGSWSARIDPLFGAGVIVTDAVLRGRLVDDSSSIERNPFPESRRLACPIRATSDGASIWGYVLFETEDAPQEIAIPSSGIISLELMELVLDPYSQNEYIRLIIYVDGTPPGFIADARESSNLAFPEIEEVSERVRSALRAAQPELSEFAKYNFDAFQAQDPSAIAEFNSILARHGADKQSLLWDIQTLERLREQKAEHARLHIEATIQPIQQPVIDQVAMVEDTNFLGQSYLLNMIFVETRIERLPAISNLEGVLYIEESMKLVPMLNKSNLALKADVMWGAGYTGGTFDALITDTGVDSSHPGLSSQLSPATEKAFSGCGTNDSGSHGTHIAGIIGSTNITYRGTAYGLDKIYNGKICSPYYWDWFVDAMEWGGMGGTVTDKAEAINFSWAMGPGSNCDRDGDYPTTRYFDAYAYLYGQLFAISAGNDGGPVCSNDNRITMPSDAFNVLAVGNVDDNNTTYRNDDQLSSGSRLGPATTPNGEYRVKPDLAAPGSWIKSTNAYWESEVDYINMSGTSMSAPAVAASGLLLMDAGLTSGLEARTMLMVSADDWNNGSAGPGTNGPDIFTGFGYVNLGTALTNLGNVGSGKIEEGDVKLFRQSGHGSNPEALLMWDRHCAGVYNYFPDIDLYVYDDSTGELVTFEDKLRDNKRYLLPGTSNDLVYKIKAEYIPFSGDWDYVLAAIGGTLSAELTPPTFMPEITHPNPLPIDAQFDIEVVITNDGDFPLRNIEATLQLDTDMTFEAGSTATQSGPALLDPQEQTIITWHVMLHAYSYQGKHIEVDVQGEAYDDAFTGNAAVDVAVEEIPPQLDVSPEELDYTGIGVWKTFDIRNIGAGELTWNIDDSGFPIWLQVTETNGMTGPEVDAITTGVDRDSLSPGPYSHLITVTSDAGNESINIIMVVPDPAIEVIPLLLEFGEVEADLGFTIGNLDVGNMAWQINHDIPNEFPSWLYTNVDTGIVLEAEESDLVIVNVSRANIDSGDYAYDIDITSDGGGETVHVTMTVADSVLYVDPLTLDFGMSDTMKMIDIENHGMGILEWVIDSPSFPAWLNVDDPDGQTKTETDQVAVYVNRDGLTPGPYEHYMDINSDGGLQTVHITMEAPDLVLLIEPGSLDFGYDETQDTLAVSNSGTGTLTWDILHGGDYEYPTWLSTNTYNGQNEGGGPATNVIVDIDRTGLSAGDYSYDMHFTSDGGDAVVPIAISVDVPVPFLEVNPALLNFGLGTDQLQINISNLGEAGSILDWDIPIAGMPEWVYANQYTGQIGITEMDVVKIFVDRDGLAEGDYSYTMQITSNGGEDSVQINMSVSADPLDPVLTGPADGYHYEVWSPLVMSWTGPAGYDGKFYLDIKLNGQAYVPFNNTPIVGNQIMLPPHLVDKMAKYGTWEWRIYTIESVTPEVKHYSGWRTLYKDAPEILTPLDGTIVDPSTEFTWNMVASTDSANTWYVIKVTGVPGSDPMYVWFKNATKAVLPPGWHQMLKMAGASEVRWKVAAVRGDPSTPGGLGMTDAYAKLIKYPLAFKFYVE